LHDTPGGHGRRRPDDLVAAVRDAKATEHVEEATAMRRLRHMGCDLCPAEQYRAGRLSLRELARRMDTSISEAMDALQRLGISGNVSAADTLHSLASLRQR
jgi:hypothetical protein